MRPRLTGSSKVPICRPESSPQILLLLLPPGGALRIYYLTQRRPDKKRRGNQSLSEHLISLTLREHFHWLLVLSEQLLYFRRQGGDDFKCIAHDAVVGNLEDWRVLVLVDSYNIL